MKLFNLKLSGTKELTLKTIVKKESNVQKYWFLSMLVFVLVFLITGIIALNLFYSVYYENYKNTNSDDKVTSEVDIGSLKKVIDKRSELLNQPTPTIKNPSLP